MVQFMEKYHPGPRSTQELVDRARNAPDYALPLGKPIPSFTNDKGKTYHFKNFHVKEMDVMTMDWAFGVLEKNMKQMYEDSEFGWHGDRKREEMRIPFQRFLIAYDSDTDRPVGFTQYQFLPEQNANGVDIPVIYCWEIMIAEEAQGQGVGWQLMRSLEKLGRAWDMEKAMLTVFTHNPNARAFYERLGYLVDEVSPSKWGMKKDYEIMSIRLRGTYVKEPHHMEDEEHHGDEHLNGLNF